MSKYTVYNKVNTYQNKLYYYHNYGMYNVIHNLSTHTGFELIKIVYKLSSKKRGKIKKKTLNKILKEKCKTNRYENGLFYF